MSISNLTLAERDRRWNLVRKEMEKRGLSCLIISSQGALALGEWLCNDVGVQFLIFPLDGELTAIIGHNQRQYDIPLTREAGAVWVTDYRMATAPSEGIIEVIKELHLENTKLGITGGGERSRERVERSPEGNIPYGTLTNLYNAFPKAEFEDITWWMCELSLPKSDEELKIIERAADIVERCSYAILSVAKPGITENEAYGAAVKCAIDEGSLLPLFSCDSGPATLAAGQPLWAQRGVQPRIIKAGDIISTEMGSHIGYYQAQVQFCVALEPVDKLHIKCNEIDQEVIQAALDTMKPGVKWSEVCNASDAPLIKAKAFTTSPNIHSMNPQILRTIMALDYGTGKPSTKKRTNTSLVQQPGSLNYIVKIRGPDAVLKKGMVFEIEPGASLEDHRVLIGGTVVIGEKKPILLNHLAFSMVRI